ncbi:hypothetical protein [Brevibacterium otitidis]|uniref:4Fe-4S single cluster domain-containing protein n=1 Tax=Brevibacterium otitidis TaxID=53364 RepID=A0ABV5X4Y5_9MICO
MVVPRHVGDLLAAQAAEDSEQFGQLSRDYPQTAATLRQAGWLDEEIVHRRVPEGPHLKRVQVEALLTCNLSCSYCYSTSGPGRRERLSHDEVILTWLKLV